MNKQLKGVIYLDEKLTTIKYLSYELGKSDREIGDIFNKHRSTISHYRNKNNIPKPITLGRRGELAAVSRLKRLGFKVEDLNLINKSSSFDLLVDDHIRIEVKSSTKNNDGRYHFAFANKPENQCKTSELVTRVKSGKTVKNYSKFADYFIFVGIDDDLYSFWVVPTNKFKPNQQGTAMPAETSSEYFCNFNLLKEGVEYVRYNDPILV